MSPVMQIFDSAVLIYTILELESVTHCNSSLREMLGCLQGVNNVENEVNAQL
jgi:hypothetical protein